MSDVQSDYTHQNACVGAATPAHPRHSVWRSAEIDAHRIDVVLLVPGEPLPLFTPFGFILIRP